MPRGIASLRILVIRFAAPGYDAVLWLASDEASYVAGHDLVVAGADTP